MIEERCDCGKLLFKKSKRGIEIKCSRCKGVHLVALERMGEEFRSLCPILDFPEKQPPVV